MSALDLNKFFLPYQVAWINSDAPLAVGEKSRRIGWTYASSARAVIRRLERGTDLFYTSADLTAAREFVEDCQLWARVADVVAEDMGVQVIDERDGITAFVLRFANGSKIYAGSSNPKFFRGKGGDADADEYAFHNDQRQLFKAMHATAMVWGHQLRLWSTHNGEGSNFNAIVKDLKNYRHATAAIAEFERQQAEAAANLAPPPEGERPAAWSGLKGAVQTVTILDAVEQGLVEKIKKLDAPDPIARRDWLEELRSTIPDLDTWNEEYMCQPSSEQSSLLTYPLITGCEVANLQLQDVATEPLHVNSPAMKWLIEAGEPLYAGFDVGRKHDRSALWVLGLRGDVYWTRMLRVIQGMPYTQQEELLALLLTRSSRVKRLCIDATGIGAMLAERLHARFGSRVEPVTFSAPVKSELAMPLVRLFQDKLVRIPADAQVREDLHSVRKTVTAAGNVRLDAERTDEGRADRFWALALAAHAADTTKIPLPRPLAQKPVGW